MAQMIRAAGLTCVFKSPRGEVTPLDGMDFVLERGEFLVVLGKSGVGKSTLLKLLAGLLCPDAGALVIEPNARIGVVFQEPRLLSWKSVRENIELALLHANPETAMSVEEVLSLVRLDEAIDAYPTELSGGMAQRVSLARALVTRPDIVLFDEPLGALDALTRRLLQRELAAIFDKTHTSAVMVTHDVWEAVLLADRIAILDGGKLTQERCITMPRAKREESSEMAQLASDILKTVLGEPS